MTGEAVFKLQKEQEYAKLAGTARLKKLGQFFTPYEIAEFMMQWLLQNAGSILDPAMGNSVFFKSIPHNDETSRTLVGYEIDDRILSYFGTLPNAVVRNEDYLLAGWDEKYDNIICNPPYNRFQAIDQKELIYKEFHDHTGIAFTKYTNQYILFLIKALYQLKPNGRLAFIIPSEFLNSKYGDKVKQLLLKDGKLRAVVNFQNDRDIFFNSMTTCCIVFLINSPNQKGTVEFVNVLDASELQQLNVSADRLSQSSMEIGHDQLAHENKWLPLLQNSQLRKFCNTVACKEFVKARRGIATGDNAYFLFNINRIESLKLPMRCFTKCISKSGDVNSIFFAEKDFDRLSDENKHVYLLDIKEPLCDSAAEYISQGEKSGVHKKHLPSHRRPWYCQETRLPAPIWVVSAGRGKIKVVRNLTDTVNLTTFHAVYVNQEHAELTNVIFCYLLTPTAQQLLKRNKKELGCGLSKFQPNDINEAMMLDLRLLSSGQVERVNSLYKHMLTCRSESQMNQCIDELDCIFAALLSEQ